MYWIFWILPIYKVPPEPAVKWIAIWRRLKGDIEATGGEAMLLETVSLDPALILHIINPGDPKPVG